MYQGDTFDFISAATKVCLLSQNNSSVQSQNTVLFTLQVSRYGLLDFQDRIVIGVPLKSLDLSMTQCVLRPIFLQWRPNVASTGPKFKHH